MCRHVSHLGPVSLRPLARELGTLRLLRGITRLLVLHCRAHSINRRLSLMGTLVNHHWRSSRSTWAGETVRSSHGLRRNCVRGHELRVGRIHWDLGSRRHHSSWAWDELLLDHHWATHVMGLLRNELGVVRETAELTHLRGSRVHVG